MCVKKDHEGKRRCYLGCSLTKCIYLTLLYEGYLIYDNFATNDKYDAMFALFIFFLLAVSLFRKEIQILRTFAFIAYMGYIAAFAINAIRILIKNKVYVVIDKICNEEVMG